MQRRRLLAAGLGGAALAFATGHTPYRQWKVFRQRYLVILTVKTDPRGYRLGKRLAAVLAARLPESRARVTRAPYLERVGSLLSTGQLDVALVRRGEANDLREGRPPFADYGPMALTAITGLGEHLLVCREDLPARHAYALAETLAGARDAVGIELTPADGETRADDHVPTHRGARAFYRGEPRPAATGDGDSDPDSSVLPPPARAAREGNRTQSHAAGPVRPAP